MAGLLALRERRLDVDLLMMVAAIGAASIGQVLDGALLIVIFATSGALEAVATRRTEESVRGLLDLAPETAVVLTPDGEHLVDARALEVGDVVLIRPGERIAADGIVVDGASDVEQATITGEPLPVAKASLFVVPLLFGAELESALLRAMTFMIVASPCAIVLATMPPLLSAIANAGRHGVLVKSAVVLERLATRWIGSRWTRPAPSPRAYRN